MKRFLIAIVFISTLFLVSIFYIPIARAAAPTLGLIGHWKFDEGTGTTASDSSGNNNTGTLTNGSTWATGKIGGAINFDGVDDYVDAPSPNLPSITISLWVKTPTPSATMRMIDRSTGVPLIRFVADAIQVVTNIILNSANLTTQANTWYHIAFTGDSSGHKLYINGVLNNSNVNAYTTSNSGNFNIGSTVNPWNGLIDEVRVYNRALSASDVTELYNYTGPTPDTQAPSVPTALTATAVSTSQINLSWNASTDNTAVTGYRIYRDSTQIATVTGTSYQDTGLTAGTTYSYTVSSYDAAGNNSSQSLSVSATAQSTPPPDTTPPTVSISSPSSGATVSGTVTVSATASDNVGVIGVQFKLDGANLGAEDTSSPYSIAWDTTFATNVSHTLTATARDVVGNIGTSQSITVTVNNIIFSPPGARTFYIDYTSGNDSNNGISKSAPWKRAPGMNGFTGVYTKQIRDTFVFKGGVTWTSSYPWVFQNGSNDNPITYTSDRAWFNDVIFSQPTFDDQGANPGAIGMANLTNAGFVTLNDLKFINCGSPQVTNSIKCLVFTNSHNITITNSTFITESWISIYFPFTTAGSYSNFTVTGNDFSRTSGAIWLASVAFGAQTYNFIYNNNTFHDFASQIGGGVHGDGAWHGFVIPKDDSTQFLDGMQFCNNRFYGDFRRSFGTTGGMTAFFFQEGGLKNALLCNNDMSFSPVQASMFDGLIVLSGGSNAQSSNIQIYNNSLVNAGTNAMSRAIGIMEGYQNVTIRNNIASGMQYAVDVEDPSGSGTTLTINNNLWNSNSGQLKWGSIFQSHVTWQAAGRDTDSILGQNPQWISPPNDLHLGSISPAINAGTNLTSLGISKLNSDKSGVPRPTSSPWDIGAYEYVSFIPDSTPPSTPANLTTSAISSSQINLSWTASTDNVGVAGYRIYRNGTQIGTATTNSYSNTALTPSTAYTYTVSAYDAAGNTSVQSAGASGTTLAATVTTTTSGTTNTATTNTTNTSTGPISAVPSTPAPNSTGASAATQLATPTTPVTTPTTPTTSSLSLTRPLYHGLTGTDVKNLQTFLIQHNYLAPTNTTGFYGVLTKQAVQKYQCAQSIVCSGTETSTGYGVVGTKTRAKLNGTTTTYVSTSKLSPAQADAIIALIQSFGADAAVIARVRRDLGR